MTHNKPYFASTPFLSSPQCFLTHSFISLTNTHDHHKRTWKKEVQKCRHERLQSLQGHSYSVKELKTQNLRTPNQQDLKKPEF